MTADQVTAPASDATAGGRGGSALSGMGRFWLVWGGQLATLIGNEVLRFAFVVRAWAEGGRASEVVLLTVCGMLPQILLSPTAGAVVDRVNKRFALRLSELVGLVAVVGLGVVHATGDLRLWEIYVGVALLGAAAAVQYPALASAVPLLVRKDQLQRADGLLGTATSAAEVCGPALAGVLVTMVGLGTIIWLDVVSFAVALVSIQIIRFPAVARPRPGPDEPRAGLVAESLYGMRYLFAWPSLRALTVVIFVVNLAMVFGYAVVQPMVLARTGNSAPALASVLTSIGVGGVAGGLMVAAWGGPRSRIRGMMWAIVGMCVTSLIMTALGRDVVVWCAAFLAGALLLQVVNATEQAIIQTKVPADRQGRVFGAVAFVSQISAPVALVLAGLLADRIFEPAAESGTGLVGLLRPLVGTGAGAGMATMLLIAGVAGILAAVFGLLHRPVRDIDVLMPDLIPDADSTDDAPRHTPGVVT